MKEYTSLAEYIKDHPKKVKYVSFIGNKRIIKEKKIDKKITYSLEGFMKYRKKQPIIDAIKWDGDNFNEIVYNFPGIICGQHRHNDNLYVQTPVGLSEAWRGDYIVKDHDGNFYRVDTDTFESEYEAIND